MKTNIITLTALFLLYTNASGQTRSSEPKLYDVKQAFEVESLVPMFVTGGYHAAICYRYKKFRFRVSVINGGIYDAEKAGLNNSSPEYKRYYKTSPGIFFGYNIWKHMELYSFLEFHHFEIEQKQTSQTQNIHSKDTGLGISYQFFIGKRFYIQPGIHVYFRGDNTAEFQEDVYKIPNIDFAPVVRLGFRCWETY